MPCCVAVESRAGFPLINTIFFWYIINMCILLCGLPLPNRNICSLLERWLKFVIAAPCYDFRHLPFLLFNARYQRKGVYGGLGRGGGIQQGQRPSSKAEEGWRRCCFFVINSTPSPTPHLYHTHTHTIFVFEAIHFYSIPWLDVLLDISSTEFAHRSAFGEHFFNANDSICILTVCFCILMQMKDKLKKQKNKCYK